MSLFTARRRFDVEAMVMSACRRFDDAGYATISLISRYPGMFLVAG